MIGVNLLVSCFGCTTSLISLLVLSFGFEINFPGCWVMWEFNEIIPTSRHLEPGGLPRKWICYDTRFLITYLLQSISTLPQTSKFVTFTHVLLHKCLISISLNEGQQYNFDGMASFSIAISDGEQFPDSANKNQRLGCLHSLKSFATLQPVE